MITFNEEISMANSQLSLSGQIQETALKKEEAKKIQITKINVYRLIIRGWIINKKKFWNREDLQIVWNSRIQTARKQEREWEKVERREINQILEKLR